VTSFSSRPTKSPKQRAETRPSPTPSLPLRRIDNIRYGCADCPRPNLGLPDRVTRARLDSTPGLLACIPESSLSLLLNCSVSCLQMMCPINQKTPTRLWWPPPRSSQLSCSPCMHSLQSWSPGCHHRMHGCGQLASFKLFSLGPVVGFGGSSGL